MKMTKEKARKTLERFLADNIQYQEKGKITLPIYDGVVLRKYLKKGYVIEEWTFRGLLKIAYNLTEEK